MTTLQDIENARIERKRITEKWDGMINHSSAAKIDDDHVRYATAVMMENTEAAQQTTLKTTGDTALMLSEVAPANVTGTSDSANLAHQDPILISLIRRSTPSLIAFDIAGVQPMSGPAGLIFFMKSRFTSNSGTEALFNTPDIGFSGDAAANPDGAGMATATAEGLNPTEMSFSIEKISVDAKSRLLKAEYSIELAQDMKAVHSLDAEKELIKILSTEITQEINREVFEAVSQNAKAGAQTNTTTPGTFDLDTDSNGRWMAEKFKGLMFQIERDANRIWLETRRGRGNLIICSADVASALSIGGKMDTTGLGGTLKDPVQGNTFVGVLNSKYKVFVDPFATTEFIIVGYKGGPLDAGIFYTPYVPMQLVRATAEATFQPKIGFRTRYGLVQHPFATAAGDGVVGKGGASVQDNIYYRKFTVANIM